MVDLVLVLVLVRQAVVRERREELAHLKKKQVRKLGEQVRRVRASRELLQPLLLLLVLVQVIPNDCDTRTNRCYWAA